MNGVNTTVPNLKDLPEINAETRPRDVAFRGGNRSVTWEEFDEQSSRAANAISQFASQGDRVAFLCEASVEHTTLFVGALKAGCVVTNLHVKAAPSTLRYCLGRTTPKVLVVDEEFVETVASELWGEECTRTISQVITLGSTQHSFTDAYSSLAEGRSSEPPDVRVAEDDIVAITWTSGSTGRPKGWCPTNRSYFLKGLKATSRFGVQRSGTTLSAFSPGFTAWYNRFLVALLAGSTVHYLRDWDARAWLRLVEEEGITRSTLVPAMWRDVLELDVESHDLSSLQTVKSAGGKLKAQTIDELRSRICQNFSQSYGATEMFATIIYGDEMSGDRIESVGRPQTGTRVRVIEIDGEPDDVLPPNEVGEIIVDGPECPVWAWRNSAIRREAFQDGWWHPGDVGYKDEDGFLYVEGRTDFMIKSKGVKVNPVTVEEVLESNAAIERAVVVGVEDEEYGQRVTAIVEAGPDRPDVKELEQWCKQSDDVGDYERPREYHFVDSLEYTPSGKPDRQATREKVGL